MSVGSIIFFPQVSARLRRTRRCCESACCTRCVAVNNTSVPHARSGVFAALSLVCALRRWAIGTVWHRIALDGEHGWRKSGISLLDAGIWSE